MANHPAGISHRRRISGVGHWRWQRYSAVVVLLLTAYLVILTAGLGTLDQGAATALVSQPINALALAVLVSVGMWHGTLGLQVVIEDYVSRCGPPCRPWHCQGRHGAGCRRQFVGNSADRVLRTCHPCT